MKSLSIVTIQIHKFSRACLPYFRGLQHDVQSYKEICPSKYWCDLLRRTRIVLWTFSSTNDWCLNWATNRGARGTSNVTRHLGFKKDVARRSCSFYINFRHAKKCENFLTTRTCGVLKSNLLQCTYRNVWEDSLQPMPIYKPSSPFGYY